jgi:hypothetical protein
LAFKLAEGAAKSLRRIRAPEKVAELLAGTGCEDGVPVTADPPEKQREGVSLSALTPRSYISLDHISEPDRAVLEILQAPSLVQSRLRELC